MSAFGGKADIDQAYVLAPQNFTPREYGCNLADRRRWRQAVGCPFIDGGKLAHMPAVALAGNMPGLVNQLARALAILRGVPACCLSCGDSLAHGAKINAPAATARAGRRQFADMVRTRFGGLSGNCEKCPGLLEAMAGIEPVCADYQSSFSSSSSSKLKLISRKQFLVSWHDRVLRCETVCPMAIITFVGLRVKLPSGCTITAIVDEHLPMALLLRLVGLRKNLESSKEDQHDRADDNHRPNVHWLSPSMKNRRLGCWQGPPACGGGSSLAAGVSRYDPHQS